MADVMIRCPRIGEAVPTGIGMDWESYKTVTMSGNSTQCRACGEMHTWEQEDAVPDS